MITDKERMMKMSSEEIFALINSHPVFHLATVEGKSKDVVKIGDKFIISTALHTEERGNITAEHAGF